jgi:ribosomal protein S27AE
MSANALPPVAISAADQRNPCPVCGHPDAVLIADLPAGRLLQCGRCGVLDYVRRDATAPDVVGPPPAA